ncbi:MAG: hypothetical protein GWN01_05100 [Nitrosopumilaceae archaeon]|nr:hypothetical protein [Nitrosopumilaceae archaeon]NIU00321.1 hypothetical protein [Nitrosopumilaceae archaeon]NIU86723.1 hypothetical protein [Nitrosopumilaceae archaeon]NIV65424.1 hypothetical protein [Nitrosopumilaceae archaeon]NIX60923.1 hypothetical protein [Nitrosopumilaceae archaeon]
MRFISIILLTVFLSLTVQISLAQEIGIATFQETAQILVDKRISQNVTASVTLQSTSIQEMQIPSELEQRISDNDRIVAIVLTNEESCILGVVNEACIMVNVSRGEEDKGIVAIQEAARKIGDKYIDDLNSVFDTNAEFHSVFVHHKDETNVALDTSGVVSGRGTVSAVYTMPKEDTQSMYEKISAILIPKVIRDSGGFFSIAKELSSESTARTTFSIIPMEKTILYQLKLSVDYPGEASSLEQINPLKFLKTDELSRSDYFSSGFYPLNSLVQVVVLDEKATHVTDVQSPILKTTTVEGEQIPQDITNAGWVFDPESGKKIQGKYIFGEEISVTKNDLMFDLSYDGKEETSQEFDESIIIVSIIVVAAIAASVYYLKGYKKTSNQ